jgi:hypothetical protein
VKESGKLIAITKGHNPEKCSLKELKEFVGQFWKIESEL